MITMKTNTGSTMCCHLAVTVRSRSPSSRLQRLCNVVVVIWALIATERAVPGVVAERRSSQAPVVGRQRNRAETAPTWSNQMQFDDVISQPTGRTVHMKCPAEGNPMPSIRWFKDNKPFARRVMGSVKLVDSKFQLRMVDVNEYDSGHYTCVVENKYGQLNWTTRFDVIARMMHAPIITDGPRNQSAYVGHTVRFACRLLSDPEYHLQWIKHIYVNESYVIANMTSNVRTEQVTNYLGEDLVIDKVTPEDAGLYSCVAANPLGVSHQNGWLDVDTVFTAQSVVIDVDAEVLRSAADDTTRWQLVLVGVVAAFSSVAVICCIGFAAFALTKRRRNYGNRSSSTRVAGVTTKTAGLARHWILPNRRRRSHACGRFEMRDNVLVYSGSPVSGVTSLPSGCDGQVRRWSMTSSAKERRGLLTEYEMPFDKQWEFPRNRLTLDCVLGEGAFGVVVKATAFGLGEGSDEAKTVAVKMLKLDATDDDVADLVHEMETMKAIGHHSNVLGLLGCCTQGGPLYVIMEYAARGNLRNFLREHRPTDVSTESVNGWFNVTSTCTDGTALTFGDLVSFAAQVANGLLYLSTNMRIHRDIAARNILVDDNYVMKIADFGLTRDIPCKDYYRKTTNGRLPVKWMAPEALFDRKYSVKSDIWSYGILLWEIFSMGGNPYPSVPVEKLYELLTDGHRMERPPYATNDVYNLMLQCWQQNPSQRPTFTTLLQQLDELAPTTACQVLRHCEEPDMTSTVDTMVTLVGGETDSQYSSTSAASL